jgi:hypothetical protein
MKLQIFVDKGRFKQDRQDKKEGSTSSVLIILNILSILFEFSLCPSVFCAAKEK